MRAIWKGAVSFGLVSVPVKLYAATESHDVSFRQVHAKDGGRIKYQRICSLDGEEVAYADIAKGYETEDGEMVILSDEDLAELPSTSSREIAVEKFVPSDQIDPMLFEKSYYLEPEKSGAKPYALLRQALLDADRMAVVTVALRQRTSVAVLRVRDDVIVLQTMMWPDEIRTPDFNVEAGEVREQEVTMARMLVETLAGDFEPEEYEDDYAEAVEALVRAKVEGGEVKRTPTSTKSSGEVVDLLAALQRSVDAARTARGEDAATSEEEPDEGRPATTGAAKKSAVKKSPAKKSPAKKSAVKKSPAKRGAAKKATSQEDSAKEGSGTGDRGVRKSTSKKASAADGAARKRPAKKAAAKKAS
ncbi:Ku protein [Nocardioides sp. SYSU DS0663]|uniref:non-homologous end joining protein Ku n=1 Tax=Nocardioides sp. SYSU DS0663 TaxID=3416445 RepID=UPI003F4B934B